MFAAETCSEGSFTSTRSRRDQGRIGFPAPSGENALALYRAANERLYARRVFRGYQRPDAQTATPVAPNERLTLDIRN